MEKRGKEAAGRQSEGTKLGNLLTHKVRKRAATKGKTCKRKKKQEKSKKTSRRMKEFRESFPGRVSWKLEDLFGLDGMAMKG